MAQLQQVQQRLQNQILQNPSNQHSSISIDPNMASSVHWKHQQKLAQISRGSNLPNFYARQAASSSRKPKADGSSTQGGTLIDITKSLLANVQDKLHFQESQPNEGLMQHKKVTNDLSLDEEAEDQRIRIKENNTQLWTGLDLSGQLIMTLSSKLFSYSFLRRLYLNGNNLKVIPPQISSLKTLRVLDLSSNNLTELPKEIGMLYNLKYLYVFDNNISDISYDFGNLYQLDFLGIEGNPNMNEEIVQIIAKKGTRGLIIHLRDDAPRLEPPEPRKWIKIGEDGEPMMNEADLKPAIETDLSSKDGGSFTLMSYNTLCQHYATPKMYRYTPSWALNWDYRRQKLTEEILSYKTNIICLQEVETRTYEEYWVPLMESNGYKGVFHRKGRSKTMSEKNAKKVDGCATFYKVGMFELLEKRILEYGTLVLSQDKFKKTEDVFNRFMNKDNIASVLILQHVQSGNKFVLANTHLHWDPEFNDVKTMQVAVLLEELQVILKKHIGPREDVNKVSVRNIVISVVEIMVNTLVKVSCTHSI
ncbi:unnamed protein product [Ambrosiozyma monospora]|uniref:CCR4-Not complex 3'-5'-exoribonuclease subunit Ccr4 n=1 Tax=Ambrosiozyma monospora TaxID=43982 RepID=A0A9W7DJA4_AMBMO|nr:unnamed protein product [Ambrosiozyma monospora]